MNSVAKDKGENYISGSVTANGRQSKEEESGFSFLNCVIYGSGKISLGRAWGPYATVVFLNTNMSPVVAAKEWDDMDDPARDTSVYYSYFFVS